MFKRYLIQDTESSMHTDMACNPSTSLISVLLQVPWSTRSCMIRSKFHTWLSILSFNPFLVGLGNSLNSCSIAFPVSHISTLGTSVCCCELVSLLRDNTLLSPWFNLDRLWSASQSTCVASSSTSSGASSVTFSSSEAGTVIMGGSVPLQGEDTQLLIS